jgi:mycofactocin precursor
MSEQMVIAEHAAEAAASQAPADVTAPAAEVVDQDLLVEEVSIDGMCGVY